MSCLPDTMPEGVMGALTDCGFTSPPAGMMEAGVPVPVEGAAGVLAGAAGVLAGELGVAVSLLSWWRRRPAADTSDPAVTLEAVIVPVCHEKDY